MFRKIVKNFGPEWGAAVWHRYIYADIPQGRLTSTTMGGIAPITIMDVFLIKFVQAISLIKN